MPVGSSGTDPVRPKDGLPDTVNYCGGIHEVAAVGLLETVKACESVLGH